MKQRNKDGVRRTSFDGDLLLTREILLAENDRCTFDGCGRHMDSADPERALVLATFFPLGTVCLRFCCREHLDRWQATEIPEQFKFLLSNSRTFALGEVIGYSGLN